MRKNLLFLAQIYPYPPTGGVTLRTYNTLRQLVRQYDVTLLSFDRRRRPAEAEVPTSDRLDLEGLVGVRVYKIPQYLSRRRLLSDHLRSVASRRVYTYYRLNSAPFLAEVRRTIARMEPDLVHVDSLDLSAALRWLPMARTAVTHHNVESELLVRRATIETSVLKKRYFNMQGDLQLSEERTWCPRVALNVTVSDRDAEELKRRVGGGRFFTAPNGVDVEYFTPGGRPAEAQSGIVFVGGTTWFPNRDALEYFASELLPRLRRRLPRPDVTWVGRATADEIRRYEALGIRMTGFVDDIRDYVRGAACFVMPFRVGGGTRLKLLDAWAMGKAVVSTTQGAEGVPAADGANMLIRDDPDEFVDAVVSVLGDAELRRKLGNAARALVETVYSWDVIGADLRQEYERMIDTPA